MRVYRSSSRLVAIVAFSAIALHAASVAMGGETADWEQAQRDAHAALIEPGASIAKLSADLVAASPKTPQEAMFKLCVLMRAGMNKEAIAALGELKVLDPDLGRHHLSHIYYEVCNRPPAWDVAKATLELFAERGAEVGSCERLLEYLLTSGWTVEKADKWLAGMPSGPRGFWVGERLRFNIKHGRGGPLLKELTDGVRENPHDIEGAVWFLEALNYSRDTGDEDWELSWLTDTIKPELATEAERIATALTMLGEWTIARWYYRRAIDTPLTDQEARGIGASWQRVVSLETVRATFAVRVREKFAECLLKLNEVALAQKWMVEAADIRKEHGILLDFGLAGRVQGASGQRTIEGRIKKEEKERKDDPWYWRDRARYYAGRNEAAQQEDALLKALALTEPLPPPIHDGKKRMSVDLRNSLLSDYAFFLRWKDRTADAVAFLRREIEQAPAICDSTRAAAQMLAYEFHGEVRVDDAVLWKWLADRAKWEYAEERLLREMLTGVRPDDLDEYFVRAEALAFGKHPSRASSLGQIMRMLHFPKRSIPLLRYAIETTTDEELRERIPFMLLLSYLDANEWEHAESIFPEASKRLTPGYFPEWYSRLAVSAARAGAKGDAMRIWGQAANLSPIRMDGLEKLVRAGLRDELKDFYRKMQKEMPSSVAPGRALSALEEK
jgi:tetratricopeptide (TPR) repeat protein